MKLGNSEVLIGSAGIFLLIIGGIWYLTHQMNFPNAQIQNTLSVATSTLATTTSTIATTSVSTKTSGKGTTGSTQKALPPTPPHLTTLTPWSGSPGLTVTIKGSGFDRTTNYVLFGNSNGRHHVDGTPDNLVAKIGSIDGTTLSFNVPWSGPSGYLCDLNNKCIALAAIVLQSGNYPVMVLTKNGTSNSLLFTLKR